MRGFGVDGRKKTKRQRPQWDHLFTFHDDSKVRWNHDLAERHIHAAAIVRKNRQSNRSLSMRALVLFRTAVGGVENTGSDTDETAKAACNRGS